MKFCFLSETNVLGSTYDLNDDYELFLNLNSFSKVRGDGLDDRDYIQSGAGILSVTTSRPTLGTIQVPIE
jgi:hypothetical protein